MDKRIVGDHTAELITGGGKGHYYFPTDMQAMELAESLPECVRWQVKLRFGRGIVDSEKYHEQKPHGKLTPPGR